MSLAQGAPTMPPPNGIWRYDFAKGQWSNITTHGDPVERIHIGSSVQSSTGEAYYLGGAKSPESDAAFLALPGALPYMVRGILSFNENSLSFKNSSTSGMNDKGTEAGGFLVLIESLGQKVRIFGALPTCSTPS